jgi:hypothetical protein
MTEVRAFISQANFNAAALAAAQTLETIANFKEDSAEEEAGRSQTLAEYSARMAVVLLLGGVGLSMLMIWLITRLVRVPQQRLLDHLTQLHLSAGRHDKPVPYADYSNELGELARAIVVLQDGAHQLDAQRWVKTHTAALSAKLQGVADATELAKLFLAELAQRRAAANGPHDLHAGALAPGAVDVDDLVALLHREVDGLPGGAVQVAHDADGGLAHIEAALDQRTQFKQAHAQLVQTVVHPLQQQKQILVCKAFFAGRQEFPQGDASSRVFYTCPSPD